MNITIAAAAVSVLLVGATFAQPENQSSIQVKGAVVPARDTAVRPKTFGRIKKLYFGIGDNIKAGDLVAEIDVLSAEEAVGNPNATLTVKGLPKSDGEPVPKQIDPALGKIYAPHGGVVATRSVVEGQVVSPGTVGDFGTTLITIWDDSTLTIQTRIPEADASRIALKQPVQFTADSLPGIQMEARISYIAPRASKAPLGTGKNVIVRAQVEKPNARFRAVRTVQLTIPTAAR